MGVPIRDPPDEPRLGPLQTPHFRLDLYHAVRDRMAEAPYDYSAHTAARKTCALVSAWMAFVDTYADELPDLFEEMAAWGEAASNLKLAEPPRAALLALMRTHLRELLEGTDHEPGDETAS